nr:MAG TPA: hypothetical protein [Caudoviricetes sp.]
MRASCLLEISLKIFSLLLFIHSSKSLIIHFFIAININK